MGQFYFLSDKDVALLREMKKRVFGLSPQGQRQYSPSEFEVVEGFITKLTAPPDTNAGAADPTDPVSFGQPAKAQLTVWRLQDDGTGTNNIILAATEDVIDVVSYDHTLNLDGNYCLCVYMYSQWRVIWASGDIMAGNYQGLMMQGLSGPDNWGEYTSGMMQVYERNSGNNALEVSIKTPTVTVYCFDPGLTVPAGAYIQTKNINGDNVIDYVSCWFDDASIE